MVTEAADLPYAFTRFFNAGDSAGVYSLYEKGALMLGALDEHLAIGKPIEVAPEQVLVTGDLALLMVRWSIVGTDVEGMGIDVARRGADGGWRYVIDNPFGLQAQES